MWAPELDCGRGESEYEETEEDEAATGMAGAAKFPPPAEYAGKGECPCVLVPLPGAPGETPLLGELSTRSLDGDALEIKGDCWRCC